MKIEQPHEQVTLYTLDNGLRVVIDERTAKYTQLSAVYGCIDIGSMHDGEQKGKSHFLEHVVNIGSRKWPIQKRTDLFQERYRGDTSANTGRNFTRYYIEDIFSNNLLEAIDAVVDTIANPVLDVQSVEEERVRILTEIRDASQDTKENIIENGAHRTLLGDHPAAYATLGYTDTVDSISQEDLADYHRAHYTPDNIVFSIAGPCDHMSALDTIARTFDGRAPGAPRNIIPPAQYQQANRIRNMRYDNNIDVGLCFESPVESRDARYDFMDNEIGRVIYNTNGPFFTELCRKQGLYSYSCDIRRNNVYGLSIFYMQVDAARFQQTAEGLVSCVDQLRRGVPYDGSAALLSVKKKYERTKASPDDFASGNATALLSHNDIYRPEAWEATANAMSPEDVTERARQLFAGSASLIVGGIKERRSRQKPSKNPTPEALDLLTARLS